MRYSVLPTKNILMSQSIVGISGILINIIKNNNYTIDKLFEEYNDNYVEKHIVSSKLDFNQFLLSLCFLYSINCIKINDKGVVLYEIN